MSLKYEWSCPQCSTRLELHKRVIQNKRTCPHCGTIITTDEIDRQATARVERANAADAIRRRRRRRVNIAWVAGISLLAFVGLMREALRPLNVDITDPSGLRAKMLATKQTPPTPAARRENPKKELPEAARVKLGEWQEIGNLRICVINVYPMQASLLDSLGQYTSSVDWLTNVQILIENTSKKIVRLESWNAARASSGKPAAMLDSQGLAYPSATFSRGFSLATMDTVYLKDSYDLAPESTVSEILLFREANLDHVGFIDIDLAASNAGEAGTFSFRIDPKEKLKSVPKSKSSPVEKK